MAIKLFEKYLNGKYRFFLEKNSSEISSNIIQETSIFGTFFLNFTTLVIEFLILLSSIIFSFIYKHKGHSSFNFVYHNCFSNILFLFKRKVKYLGSERKIEKKKI